MAIDPYLYPDSKLLQNMRGLRSETALAEAIDRISHDALAQMGRMVPVISTQGLCDLHRAMFANLFSWAGQLRSVDLFDDGHAYARVDLTLPSLDAEFASFLKYDDLHDIAPERLFDVIALHISELNAIAPFRAGNEAVLQIYASQLVESLGHGLDWRLISNHHWQTLLSQSFVTLDHLPIARALHGQQASEAMLANLNLGTGGMPLPPPRDPPIGKHYVTPLHKVRTLLGQHLQTARSLATVRLNDLLQSAAPETERQYARQELGFLRHPKGPLFQLDILEAIGVQKVRALLHPEQSPLEIVRELSAAIAVAFHGYPTGQIAQLVRACDAPPYPAGVSPHNERLARRFLSNSASANRLDPRFAAFQRGLDEIGLGESVAGGVNAKSLADRVSQARMIAAAQIRGGEITLGQSSSAASTRTGVGADNPIEDAIGQRR
jgi:cell filamentation protein